MTFWHLFALAVSSGSAIAYAVISIAAARYKNGGTWAAFQVTLLAGFTRSIAMFIRAWKDPTVYLEFELELFIIEASMIATAIASWVLSFRMASAFEQHHRKSRS